MGVCAGKGYVSTVNAVVLDKGTLNDVFEEESATMLRRMRSVYEEAMPDPLALRSVNLSFARLDTAGFYQLGKLLSFTRNIKVLKLWKCQLGRKGAEFLILDLGSLQVLEVLGLEDNCLGLEGTVILAPVIGSLQQLRELFYHTNDLETSGTLALVRGLTPLQHLATLTLDENRMTDEGVLHMFSYLSLSSLQFLGLSYNGISDEGAQAILSYAEELTSLSRLALAGNKFSAETHSDLKRAFPASELN